MSIELILTHLPMSINTNWKLNTQDEREMTLWDTDLKLKLNHIHEIFEKV